MVLLIPCNEACSSTSMCQLFLFLNTAWGIDFKLGGREGCFLVRLKYLKTKLSAVNFNKNRMFAIEFEPEINGLTSNLEKLTC